MKRIKDIDPLILIPIIVIIGFLYYIYRHTKSTGHFGPYIEQEMRISDCPNIPPRLATYVWYEGKIAESWYDEVNTLTDSIKQTRLAWAKDYAQKIKIAQ